MEPNPDAEEPTPSPTPEPAHEPAPEPAADFVGETDAEPTGAPENAGSGDDRGGGDELGQLAEAAARARLSAAEEERLLTLLKEALLGGRAGVARAVEVIPKLPWIIGVRGVEQVWPELTAGFRTQLLSGLAKDESDGARRMRLSLARALFKLEAPVALKLAVGVLKDLKDKNPAGLAPKDAQIISNVFIGRGKPWLVQLPVAELKPAEIDLLVHSAVLAVFAIPHPPVTQLGVLKWAQDAGRLGKLQESALTAATSVVARWSAKWQNALRNEVAELPGAIVAVLKPVPAAQDAGEPAAEEPEGDAEDETPGEPSAETAAEDDQEGPKKERPVYTPRPQKPPQATEAREAEAQKERPVYTPRSAAASVPGGRGFNLNEALRAIEAHVQSLRNELTAAQAKQRQKEGDRRGRREKIGPIIEGEPTLEELARLNLQLEARNAELQSRIEELTQHSEDVAASLGVISGQPVSDTAEQLRTLLGLKLREDFEDFLALERESDDLVVQQHYRTIIRHVFDVLHEVQIPLEFGPEESR